jgi:hypothetical protein
LARAALHARVDRLDAEHAAHWGEMHAHQMVCHAADQLRVALGDVRSRPRPLRVRLGARELKTSPGLLRFRWYRQLIVHWAPWPKARFRAPPEMFSTAPGTWRDDVAALHALIDRVGRKDPADEWGLHPWFGPVAGREWGMLCWKHTDYHLRQFGV